ncbi:MAG: hypothetical protein ACRBBN_03055 [Methyloligellaceae bacterium]
MKKSEPKSEIEIDEIKTILNQLQSMQVPTNKNTPQSNASTPPKSPVQPQVPPASSAPEMISGTKGGDYTIIAAFSACFAASLIGGFFLYNNHNDVRNALKDFTNPKITGNRVENTEKTEKVERTAVAEPVELRQNSSEVKKNATLSVPYTSNTNPYPPKNNRNVKKAEALMKQGKIQEARMLLTKEASQTAAADDLSYVDVAFLLAQSYDPNYLSSLSFSDSDADLIEAERWYRQWYKVASKKGIVKNQQSLQGILETLR